MILCALQRRMVKQRRVWSTRRKLLGARALSESFLSRGCLVFMQTISHLDTVYIELLLQGIPLFIQTFDKKANFTLPVFCTLFFSFWYWRTRKIFSLSRNSKQRLLLRIPQFTFLLLWQTFTRSTSTLMKSSTSRELFLLPAKSPFTINGEYKNTTVTDVYDWKPFEISMTGGMDAPNRCHSFF